MNSNNFNLLAEEKDQPKKCFWEYLIFENVYIYFFHCNFVIKVRTCFPFTTGASSVTAGCKINHIFFLFSSFLLYIKVIAGSVLDRPD
jgi:hypothetical protein